MENKIPIDVVAEDELRESLKAERESRNGGEDPIETNPIFRTSFESTLNTEVEVKVEPLSYTEPVVEEKRQMESAETIQNTSLLESTRMESESSQESTETGTSNNSGWRLSSDLDSFLESKYPKKW